MQLFTGMAKGDYNNPMQSCIYWVQSLALGRHRLYVELPLSFEGFTSRDWPYKIDDKQLQEGFTATTTVVLNLTLDKSLVTQSRLIPPQSARDMAGQSIHHTTPS